MWIWKGIKRIKWIDREHNQKDWRGSEKNKRKQNAFGFDSKEEGRLDKTYYDRKRNANNHT